MNPQVFAKLQHAKTPATLILGDGCNPGVLRDAKISEMGAVVAVTGDDEDNLVVAKLAKHEYQIGRVIARINNSKNEWLFTPKMGVDLAVSHVAMLARVIHEELGMGDLVPLLKLAGGRVGLVELTIAPQAAVAGRRVDSLTLPAECVLATVVRNGELIIPRGDTVLAAADKVIALVNTSEQDALVAVFS